jgi:hypothetical protein
MPEEACSLTSAIFFFFFLCVLQTSTTVIPIGYGVGQFELELTKGAPQLWADTPETAVTELESVPLAAAAAAFDLSYVPAPQGDVSQLRGSWAADKTATSSMEPKLREQEELEKRQRQLQQEGQHHELPLQQQQQQPPQQQWSNEQQQRSSMQSTPAAASNATPIRQATQAGQQQDPFAALRASLHNAPPDFFDAPPPSSSSTASVAPSAPVADVAASASSPAAPVAPTFVPAGSATPGPVPVPADSSSSDAPASSAASTRSYIDRPKSQLPLEMRLVLEGSIILFQNFIVRVAENAHLVHHFIRSLQTLDLVAAFGSLVACCVFSCVHLLSPSTVGLRRRARR